MEPSEDFFRALMDAYICMNREDIDEIESLYNIPFFSYHDGGVHVYADGLLEQAHLSIPRHQRAISAKTS